MNYGEIIKAAFWITLRNRYLWFFGFFAGGTSAGTGFNVPSGGSGGFDDDDFGEPGQGGFGDSAPASGVDPGQWISDNLASILVIAALVVLIVLVFVILSLISQGALAESVAALDRGESRRFSSAFRAGLSNFWRVFGYYLLFLLISLGLLLVFLAIVVPLVLLVAGVFAGTESVGARVLTVVLAGLVGFVLLILLIIVYVLLSIIAQFALREVVVGRERVVASIGSGYRLLRRNLGRSLLLWLIQLAISIGAGIALLIILLILGIILIGPGAGLLWVANYTAVGILVLIVGGLIFGALFLVASGALGAFNHSYWTLAYLRLVAPAGGATLQPGQGA